MAQMIGDRDVLGNDPRRVTSALPVNKMVPASLATTGDPARTPGGPDVNHDSPAVKAEPTAHQLYRMYASDGQLLYIGISKSALVRMTQHAHDKHWWGEVANITIEHYELFRDEMEEIERRAIKREQPKYNRAHRSLEPRRLSEAECALISDCCDCGWAASAGEAMETANGKTIAAFKCGWCSTTWIAEFA